MANRNDGHPSCDHGLKHSTFLADPHWSAPRIGFHLNPSTMQRLLGSTLWWNKVRSNWTWTSLWDLWSIPWWLLEPSHLSVMVWAWPAFWKRGPSSSDMHEHGLLLSISSHLGDWADQIEPEPNLPQESATLMLSLVNPSRSKLVALPPYHIPKSNVWLL